MSEFDIKALRTGLDLTQKALAEIVGVNSNTVARWERGELGISPGMTDRLLAMAQSLPSGAAITRTSGVTLDRHHRAILDGLNRRLDPEGVRGMYRESAPGGMAQAGTDTRRTG